MFQSSQKYFANGIQKTESTGMILKNYFQNSN